MADLGPRARLHRTTVTPLPAPIPVSLADPSGGPVLARSSTVLPCPAVPSGELSGLHLPSFSTNLVSNAVLQDAGVDTFTPGRQLVAICTCSQTGRHLATFARAPGSSRYTLTTASRSAPLSPQLHASAQVATQCECRRLSHDTLLWHHRLGHPSLPRLRSMHSRFLVSGLLRSLPPLPPSPAPPCIPCFEGRQRAAPHSSSFSPTEAPLHTLHLDVGGEFSSDLLAAFCAEHGIRQKFTLPASPQQNGVAERRIGLVMEVARTSMIHAAAPHFLWPFAVRYAAHQLNLWPRVSLPETSPTLLWTGKVGDASRSSAGVAGPGGARTGSTGSAGAGGGAAGGTAHTGGAGTAEGTGAAGGAGAAGGVGAAGGAGAAGGIGAARGAGSAGGTAHPRLFFAPPSPSSQPPPDSALSQVLSLPLSTGLSLQPGSPLPAPSPYTEQPGGLAERREPVSRPVSPVSSGRHVPLPPPPASSLPVIADPASDRFRAEHSTVTRLLATVVTDPSLKFASASALVSELVAFAAQCRLDYAVGLVAESASVCPPFVGGECALGTEVLEDRQEDLECLAAAAPHLVSMLLAPEGDPDAPDIPTPRSYAEAIVGEYSSQWQTAMDAKMASWKSTGTYVDEFPPPGANIVSGMWIFRVKRPPEGVDFFQTFSPTPKMTTLRVLLDIAAQRDYELHSLDFSTAFLQGSLHEEIWLRRPPGFTGSFPPGTQWSLRRPVYGLRQAPREWHDTLRSIGSRNAEGLGAPCVTVSV
ncbi:unnamed protein product [Closterium sp. NIES-53]